MDIPRLQESFGRLAAYGDDFAGWFYADLFFAHPETRDLFPESMAAQRAHLLAALTRIVAGVSQASDLTAYLRHLGITHRRFGVRHDGGHYEAVASSLLATLAYFEGSHWTPGLEADWTEAYGIISGTMRDAATADEQHAPPWHEAVITAVHRPALDVTILHVQVDGEPPVWQGGQSFPVEAQRRRRLWRWYSPANACRGDGRIEFHIRAAGTVSTVLATSAPGDRLRLGAPAGTLTLSGTGVPVLLVAQSTGVAPMKAIIEQASAMAHPPDMRLLYAATTAEGLYCLDDLEKLAAACPQLTVVPVTGRALADVIAETRSWAGWDACVAGPSSVTAAVTAALAAAGPARVQSEDFGWNEPDDQEPLQPSGG